MTLIKPPSSPAPPVKTPAFRQKPIVPNAPPHVLPTLPSIPLFTANTHCLPKSGASGGVEGGVVVG